MSIQAMKMALEALGNLNGVCTGSCEPMTIWVEDEIEALRAAITEAEWQEPVALTCNTVTNTGYVYIKALDRTMPHVTKLYTAPQPAIPEWRPTNEELTAIYMKANGIEGKNPPITTERIFTAMRAMLAAAPKPEGQ